MPSNYFESALAVVDRPVTRVAESLEFWRKDDPVIKDGKVSKGGMWEPQRIWWNLPNFVKLLVGGYGAGKSILLCKRAISLALQNPLCPIAVVSPTFPMARQTTITTIQALLSGKQTIYGRQFWWKYNKQTHEFRIKFRGRLGIIIIYSGDNPETLKGPNLAAALIDEPFIQDEAVFEQMIARVRHPDAMIKEVGLGGTPEQLGWGYELCMGESKDRYDVGYVRASTRSNLALDQSYVKRLEGALTGKAGLAYIEGQFVNLSTGLVYYGFNSTKYPNVVDLPLPPAAELGCGMDFNVNPMAAIVFWRVGSHIHVFEEIELPNSDTQYMCSVLRERFTDSGPRKELPNGYALHNIYPDPTGLARKTASPGGKTDFHYIREAGLHIFAPTGSPLQRDRENAVNGKLAPLYGEPTLTISPKCKKLAKYLLSYSHEMRKKQESYNHMLSALGYAVHYLFPIIRPPTVNQYKLSGL